MRRLHIHVLAAVAVLSVCSLATMAAAPAGRFFIEGDGALRIVNGRTGAGGLITYRTPGGDYPEAARARLDQVFGVPAGAPEGMSLRLIALLDYLQDRLKGGTIRIISGYRSPTYNEGLRSQGRLAARTSMHIEGMAADIEMQGVSGRRLWMFVRSLNCCGAGYYHTSSIHVDVGPRRFWDETTTGVDQDLGARNKLVLLRTDWDVYRPGQTVRMSLGRITDFPLSVRRGGQLIHAGRAVTTLRLAQGQGDCLVIPTRAAARSLTWTIPQQIAIQASARIRLSFCHRPFPEMPEAIDSNPIAIR
jgi:uncharacterized protein YcbK (DUF882 family)